MMWESMVSWEEFGCEVEGHEDEDQMEDPYDHDFGHLLDQTSTFQNQDITKYFSVLVFKFCDL